MDELAMRMSKIGGSMLIIALFLVLILVFLAQLTWFELFLMLATMAILLRLNIARVDRKYARSREPGRED